ncbi:MAG: SAM-dependent methyltransferase [Candidatus Acidiferrales bacterium]
MKMITMTPIGIVRSSRKLGLDDNWDDENTFVELDASQFSPEALTGTGDFSHVEILFYMDQVEPGKVEKTARHPRNNPEWPRVGIFAQRSKNRPNQIGTTICRIIKVEGMSLHVEGLDAIDGSPVLDIKPWVAEFGPRGPAKQPRWISELMQNYWRS